MPETWKTVEIAGNNLMSSFSELVDFAKRKLASKPPMLNAEESAESRPPVPSWLIDFAQRELRSVEMPEELTDMDELDILPEVIQSGPTLAELGDPGWDPDVLAYYLPFRLYGLAWGIYIRASGVVAFAKALSENDPGGSITRAAVVARQALFEHEFFHCLAETACTRIEAAAILDYRPTLATASNELIAVSNKLYERYFQHKFSGRSKRHWPMHSYRGGASVLQMQG